MIRLSKKDIPTRYHLPIKVYAPLSMYHNCISYLIHSVSVYKATPGYPSPPDTAIRAGKISYQIQIMTGGIICHPSI